MWYADQRENWLMKFSTIGDYKHVKFCIKLFLWNVQKGHSCVTFKLHVQKLQKQTLV